MTLDEARANIGRAVTYRPHPAAPIESGIITSVGTVYVFVRYDNSHTSQATRPDDLQWEFA